LRDSKRIGFMQIDLLSFSLLDWKKAIQAENKRDQSRSEATVCWDLGQRKGWNGKCMAP
jgi:hypothetical protein